MEVYVILNSVNGKKYIGQTVRTSSQRLREHLSDASNGSHFALHKDMRKAGKDAFSLVAIVRSPFKDEIDRAERWLIAEFNTLDSQYGYNMTKGGSAWRKSLRSLEGRKHPPNCEHCRKSSVAHRGLVRSQETRDKMSHAAQLRWTPEERQKQAERLKGKAAWNKGKVMSPEYCAIMRSSNTQRTRTHCPRGHALFGDNLYVTPVGRRACRECRRQATRSWRKGVAA